MRWTPSRPAPDAEFVRVFHPHGIVSDPRYGYRKQHPILLRARDYDRQWARPLGESAVSQLGTFLTQRCLFYGFSGADYAVRPIMRIANALHASYGRRPPHVLLMSTKNQVDASGLLATAAALQDLGVYTVFTDDFPQQVDFVDDLYRMVLRGLWHSGVHAG